MHAKADVKPQKQQNENTYLVSASPEFAIAVSHRAGRAALNLSSQTFCM